MKKKESAGFVLAVFPFSFSLLPHFSTTLPLPFFLSLPFPLATHSPSTFCLSGSPGYLPLPLPLLLSPHLGPFLLSFSNPLFLPPFPILMPLPPPAVFFSLFFLYCPLPFSYPLFPLCFSPVNSQTQALAIRLK